MSEGSVAHLSDALSTERPLEPRDLLRFDVGCSYYGYQSDIARTGVVGEPTKLQAQRFAALLERECELARDGAHTSDILSAVVAAVEKKDSLRICATMWVMPLA